MNTAGKVKSFVKQFVAKLSGDDNEALAQKALRQADSALKTQISNLTGDIINYEDALEAAKEAQASARVNDGKIISDRETYVENLLEAKNDVTEAEEALETHRAKIAFLQGELEALSSEVDA